MNTTQRLLHTVKRYRTLQTHRISALPIVILMPHSACNCRCVMCDIWKDNKNLRQLTEQDIEGLVGSLRKLGTQQVVMSGGEALLNPKFFELCTMLKAQGMQISLLSTGMTLANHAANIVRFVDHVIVSLDGDEALHNTIRNIPTAYDRLRNGIAQIRQLDPGFPISARTVIHRLNFKAWDKIISSAQELELDSISFLPADVSSHAFNREVLWSEQRQDDIRIAAQELPELQAMLTRIKKEYDDAIRKGFIAENEEKLQKIYQYYAAMNGQGTYPYKRCNAPWVSTVVEPDGSVRPCFFHQAIGNIHDAALDQILNSEQAIQFRKELDMDKDSTCVKCVCYLNLAPRARLG